MLSQGLWDDRPNRKWHERIYEIALRTGDFPTLVQVLISSVVQASRQGRAGSGAHSPCGVGTDCPCPGELRPAASARHCRMRTLRMGR